MFNNIKNIVKIMLLIKKEVSLPSISDKNAFSYNIRDGYVSVEIMFRGEITVRTGSDSINQNHIT